MKNNKEKVSSKSLFDEDSDGALGSISKQSKSKEENSGRSDDLGEFDFSKLDKLGDSRNTAELKYSLSLCVGVRIISVQQEIQRILSNLDKI